MTSAEPLYVHEVKEVVDKKSKVVDELCYDNERNTEILSAQCNETSGVAKHQKVPHQCPLKQTEKPAVASYSQTLFILEKHPTPFQR